MEGGKRSCLGAGDAHPPSSPHRGGAGHQSASGEQLYCISLVFLGFHSSFIAITIISIIIFYFAFIIKLLLTHGFYFFSYFPSHQEVVVSEQLCDHA